MFNRHAVLSASHHPALFQSLFLVLALQLPLTTALIAADGSSAHAEPDHPAHPHEPSLDSGTQAHPDTHDHAPNLSTGPDHQVHDGSVPLHEKDLGHDPSEHRNEISDHDHEHDEPARIHLSAEQRRTLDLEISVLEPRELGLTLNAPGEVRLNAYATAQVTPRIEAQVVARHARLGDRVERGQPLVTLSSVVMAQAQGDLVVAEREWQRLAKLKGQFVSDRDYLEASVARQKALSSVLAYGLTQDQTNALVGASEKADGTFDLLAPQGGTLVSDAFILGELVKPGRVLFEITDESVRWVEAQMPPEEAALVSVDDLARIAYGDIWLDGRVTQIHHLLDETTRTQAVRVEVPDPGHRLHPGVFVDVTLLSGRSGPVLALPESAVLRGPDGDWQLFVAESEDDFTPVEVDLVRTTGGLAVIRGIGPGTRVVTRGAFFLQSELAKGGFDPHNH